MKPRKQKSMTPAEMRAHIESAPLIGDGLPIHKRNGGMAGYDMAARSMARAFLILCEENPALLDVPSKEKDPYGIERAFNNKLWDAFKARWPDGDEWLGGTTGFQYGWAHGAVRYILGMEQVGNPAIMTITTRGE